MYIGAIEGDGTKFICAIGNEKGEIIKKVSIPTLKPIETLDNVINFFKEDLRKIDAIGIGLFGPVDININSENYGCILNSPKKDWTYFNVLNYLNNNLPCEYYLQTDVNVACLGEVRFGSSRNYKNVLYITIGTGIGAGAFLDNKLYNGVLHPEMGHIILNNPSSFMGICPFHKNCFEGLCSGPAIYKHYGIKGEDIIDESIWDETGKLVGEALYNYSCILNPERIIIGGGVSKSKYLLKYVKKYLLEFNNNYIQNKYLNNIDDYVINASLNDESGILGCIALVLDKKGIKK